METFVGIDVGGTKKGFHAVALDHTRCEVKTTSDASALASWCLQFQPQTIAVDAPCRWSLNGRARQAERELMQQRIWCFSTPTREAALAHPKNQFGWMLAGEGIYAEFMGTHPIYDGATRSLRQSCIETFPHAVVCALQGQVIAARNKATVRRNVLTKLGIDVERLTNIDLVDAALCAVAAREFARGTFITFGHHSDGFIVVPSFKTK